MILFVDRRYQDQIIEMVTLVYTIKPTINQTVITQITFLIVRPNHPIFELFVYASESA